MYCGVVKVCGGSELVTLADVVTAELELGGGAGCCTGGTTTSDVDTFRRETRRRSLIIHIYRIELH